MGMGMGGMGGGDFPTAIIEGPPGPPGSKGDFTNNITLIVITIFMKWFLGMINDLIFKVSLDDLVWMLNQADQEFLATRVEEEKEEKKGYQESLGWKVKVECQELKDLRESQAHLYV